MTKQKIKLISHRGNVNGQNIERENTLSYIDEANFLGYDVEIDVWMSNGYLSFLSSFCDLKTFFHENERYTYISNGVIWAHDISDIDNNCIIPLLEEKQILDWTKQNVYGICSDYVELFK